MYVNNLRKHIRNILESKLLVVENINQADKIYFNKGLLSPKVREVILRITGGDGLTKIISDIYYAEIQQQHRTGKMALAGISDDPEDDFEYDGGHIQSEDDVMRREDWLRIKDMYLQLKSYNKNVFPIKGYSLNGVKDIWSLIRSLKERSKIIEDIKKLPSVAIRNMKEDIRTERDSAELQHYRDRLEYFLAEYSLLSNREGRIKATIEKKMFRAGITIEDLVDFAEEKENLIGGKKLSKSIIKKIIDENYDELSIVYEKGNMVVVDVTGPEGIKAIGCNSVWCFTYGKGVYRNRGDWDSNSTNDHVYVIIDFSEESDSPYFMYVLIKPLDFNSEIDDENGDKANSEKMADMSNNFTDNPLGIIDDFMTPQEAYMIFNFGEYREGPKSQWPYQDPNQLKLDLKEIRMMIRKALISEAKKSKFEKLQDNKVPLTDEEREKVMKADAIWHHGPNGEPSPAVWKSKDKKGKFTYVTATHRAYNTAPTLKGAISRYHKFIKGTA